MTAASRLAKRRLLRYNNPVQHVGVDIVEIRRIAEAIAEHGETFLQRVYTPAEVAAYRQKLPSLAARFAAKEAVIKALSCTALSLTDIEVLSDPEGKPLVNLYGKAKERALSMKLSALDISLSHSREYAVAFAVALSAP
jgi:holo-[acyl-carrier protein] synthase